MAEKSANGSCCIVADSDSMMDVYSEEVLGSVMTVTGSGTVRFAVEVRFDG